MRWASRVRHRAGRRAPAAIGLAVGALLAFPTAASAHGGEGEPQEGYVLIQQALGYLGHDGAAGIEPAMEKVDDALSAPDQEGVDRSLLEQGRAALEARDVAGAENTLQTSITAAVSHLMPATGVETGTTIIAPDLPGRRALTGQDWVFLAVSVALVVLGVALAALFRPEEPLRVIRAHLGGPQTAHVHAH